MLKLLALATILYVGSRCSSDHPDRQSDILSLPPIEYIGTDSIKKTIKNSINKNKSIVIAYFDSECHFCHAETLSYLKNIDEITNVHIYFLSKEPLINIKLFKSKYGITDEMPITIGKDINDTYLKLMKIPTIPSTIVYNENHKLIKFYGGEVLWPEIKQALSDNIQL